MRLDGFLAQASGLSRKEARRAINRGLVSVNGKKVRSASHTVTTDDRVDFQDHNAGDVSGLTLALPNERYLMLNKPAGMVTATTDSSQPVVLDLLPPELKPGLHPVGRLDKDTTGLLLLTTDGQWSHRITSPRRACPKTYRVSLAEPLAADARQQLETGVLLNGEARETRPARVELIDDKTIDLTITEGRYHQVKRMLAAVGNHVAGLDRRRIGNISLDPGLAPGQYRELTPEETAAFSPSAQNDQP
ncbi:pseudouridine synthase [uncultured Marinobacter sp.]|uniref:pseudouridine synthase n=1 Tax=uncultured Marinobacter sp. TaxID=187379 RepID=UPI0030DB2B83